MSNRLFKHFSMFILIFNFLLANQSIFMTELTDPQNSGDVGRYVELYNNSDSDVNLSAN